MLIPAVTIVSLFFIGVISIAVRAQMRKVMTGGEGMIGAVDSPCPPCTKAARSSSGESTGAPSARRLSKKGKQVVVVGVNELKVEVEEALVKGVSMYTILVLVVLVVMFLAAAIRIPPTNTRGP